MSSNHLYFIYQRKCARSCTRTTTLLKAKVLRIFALHDRNYSAKPTVELGLSRKESAEVSSSYQVILAPEPKNCSMSANRPGSIHRFCGLLWIIFHYFFLLFPGYCVIFSCCKSWSQLLKPEITAPASLEFTLLLQSIWAGFSPSGWAVPK